MMHYEDLEVGGTYDLAAWTITRSEIINFAKRWDPQPFHVDATTAEESIFGGIVASGINTMAVGIRLTFDGFYSDVEALGGLGMDEVRLPTPVHPDDTLSGHVEIGEKRPSDSNPEWGVVSLTIELSNQGGETVLEMGNNIIVARRDAD